MNEPRPADLDGTVTNPDTARARAVQTATWLAGPSGQTADGMAAHNGRALGRLVLWLDTHLSTAGALPTAWAADGTSRDDEATPARPVADVVLPATAADSAALDAAVLKMAAAVMDRRPGEGPDRLAAALHAAAAEAAPVIIPAPAPGSPLAQAAQALGGPQPRFDLLLDSTTLTAWYYHLRRALQALTDQAAADAPLTAWVRQYRPELREALTDAAGFRDPEEQGECGGCNALNDGPGGVRKEDGGRGALCPGCADDEAKAQRYDKIRRALAELPATAGPANEAHSAWVRRHRDHLNQALWDAAQYRGAHRSFCGECETLTAAAGGRTERCPSCRSDDQARDHADAARRELRELPA